ncbi:MAG: hypothetical protein ACLQM8_18025 [Limisphaerales bacterium]
MDEPINLERFVTFLACALAAVCLVFIGYLIWRRFGPSHRHRKRRSRLRRYVGKS